MIPFTSKPKRADFLVQEFVFLIMSILFPIFFRRLSGVCVCVELYINTHMYIYNYIYNTCNCQPLIKMLEVAGAVLIQTHKTDLQSISGNKYVKRKL